jgi:exosortase
MKWMPWAAFGLFLFAYRALITFDPAADSRLEGAERVLYDSASSSPAIIFILTALFLFNRRARLAALAGRQSAPLLSGIALSLALLLFLWSHYVTLSYLLVSSLSLLLLGGALLVGGMPALRVMLFPALFLLLALPLPTVLINQVSYWMQVTNAGITQWLLTQVGLTSLSLGDHIYYDRNAFKVIEACTGLRAVQTLFMTSFVFIEMLERRGPQAWLLVISSPIIGLVTNEIRILSIVLNPGASIATVHTLQGLVMIVVGVLLMAGLDVVLGRFFSEDTPDGVPAPDHSPHLTPGKQWIALLALGSLLLGISVALPSWEAPDLAEPRLSRLSSAHDGWVVTERLPIDYAFYGSTKFAQTMLREYVKGDDEIMIFMGMDDGLAGSNRALSPKTIAPGSGWELTPSRTQGLPDSDWYLARSLEGPRLIYHKNYNMESFAKEFWRSLLGLGRGPFRRPERPTVLRVSTIVERTPNGLREAKERLDAFLTSFEEPLAPYKASTAIQSSSP